ncbi:hypothetical protein PghCCS26_60720 [Paenibacillus glycanilyticus]|uniref:Activator of Hsp90 ATPase homologue 1/2-like C-terminal domain-containing protein n=1 Tax=Paenibacillus glycanilyticus TaxID=126569 RepID=A0ABQ6NV12_9BACL|nr:SRPBCC domain-containing protein [Paenibacillus glycanilyticus]GMK48942.1 hypothetical protein PghCCS26_60720 [Paenibacillus glycanilyticus]
MGFSEKIVGKTASAGFQIGVRRTLPVSPERAWAFLTSAEGLKLWIGSVKNLEIEAGETFQSAEGISGELRIVKPRQQLRLKWTKPGWEKPSTLQIRLISSGPEKTTVSFHQENLDHAATREQMKLHWEDVLNVMLQKNEAR